MKKRYLIIGFAIAMFIVFAILFLSVKSYWSKEWSPAEWPKAAQATLAAAITAGIVSIFGICLKFIFDQISSETIYNQKISEKMISKIHTYAEKYYVPRGVYARNSASQLNGILKKEQASTEQDKQLALFFITKYFQYKLKLKIERGGLIFLKDFDSESYLVQLNTEAERCLKLTTEQICRLQKSIALKDLFLDFLKKIQRDHELKNIYEAFEIWLKDSSTVEKTIKCFQCYSELMFHELNSIYKPWYKSKAPEISPECERILRTLKKKEEEKLNN